MDSSTGQISTYAGIAGQYAPFADGPLTSVAFNTPCGIAIDSSGTIYVADWGNAAVRMITGGTVTTIAGVASGTPGWVDGVSAYAQFNRPLVRI